ncbi:MAG: outer membrane protein assembly factor BamD [candidate division WOR-3 bacterium]|nr:MAG: outer membrane protein assembly factor BamD [candidate division WOR-3 bacterium]
MKISSALVLSLVLLISCGSRPALTQLSAEDEFERAVEYFDNEQYDIAVLAFERILFYHPTSEFVDDAQYWLGRSYYASKEYDQAIAEFDYLIKNFSKSKFIEEAFLYRAKSYLMKAPPFYKDPTEIEHAINLFDDFLTRFPNSVHTDDVKDHILMARNRLAKKELENGKLYIKMGEEDAALLYLMYIVTTYPETESSNEARYLAASIFQSEGQYDDAIELYEELLQDDDWKQKAQKALDSIERPAEEAGKEEESS